MAICLSVEAAELLEIFLWKNENEVNVNKLSGELADVLYSAFLLADHYDLDVAEIIGGKLQENAERYPIPYSKGSNKKYGELD